MDRRFSVIPDDCQVCGEPASSVFASGALREAWCGKHRPKDWDRGTSMRIVTASRRRRWLTRLRRALRLLPT